MTIALGALLAHAISCAVCPLPVSALVTAQYVVLYVVTRFTYLFVLWVGLIISCVNKNMSALQNLRSFRQPLRILQIFASINSCNGQNNVCKRHRLISAL